MGDKRDIVRMVGEASGCEGGAVPEDRLLGEAGIHADGSSAWDGVLAIYTDKVEWTTAAELDRGHLGNLLELRAYNGDGEFHAVRDVLGGNFSWRCVSDKVPTEGLRSYDAYFDDEQQLDIDARRSSGYEYVTTGGGSYRLPVEGAQRIVVRNYIRYDEDGMARIVDFRIVRLVRGGQHA